MNLSWPSLSFSNVEGVVLFCSVIWIILFNRGYFLKHWISNKHEAELKLLINNHLLLLEHKGVSQHSTLFWLGNDVRVHGLRNDLSELNGKIGTIYAYGPSVDKHRVDIAGKLLWLSADNMKLVSLFEGGQLPDSEAVLRHHFFTPGMVYEGTIEIPDQASSSRDNNKSTEHENTKQSHKLIIVDHMCLPQANVDSCGLTLDPPPMLTARHQINGREEKSVFIRIINASDVDSPFSIEYIDGESVCRGTWNPSRSCFEGTVRHTVNNSHSEGYPFTLWPFGGETTLGTSKCRSRAHRNNYNAKTALYCLEAYVQLMLKVFPRCPPDVREQLFVLFWDDLFEASMHEVRRASGYWHYHARLLDSLTFDNPRHRAKCLAELADSKKAGCTRLVAKRSIFAHMTAVKFITDTWIALEPDTVGKDSRVLDAYGTSKDLLNESYAMFCDSLTRAESRLTKQMWKTFRREFTSAEGGEDNCCAICITPLDDAAEERPENGRDFVCGGRLQLPCSHAFHEQCIRQWLYNNSNCPVCRASLQEEEEKEPE